MWVFAYGSLMSSGWEKKFSGSRHERALLYGFRRSFNKKSTRNWGSSSNPCPTLGLEQDASAKCVGCAFEFPDAQTKAVTEYLCSREGPSFELQKHPIYLADGTAVQAIVAVNKLNALTYIGNLTVDERAAMVRAARGSCGSCKEYLQSVCSALQEIGVEDPYVKGFVNAVKGLHNKR